MNGITLIVIFAIYAGIFLAQYKKKEDGTIVSFEGLKNCRNGGFGVIVRLKDGNEARATVSGCTACMDNLKEGSSVKLLKLGEEYLITHSPLDSLKSLKKRQCNSVSNESLSNDHAS